MRVNFEDHLVDCEQTVGLAFYVALLNHKNGHNHWDAGDLGQACRLFNEARTELNAAIDICAMLYSACEDDERKCMYRSSHKMFVQIREAIEADLKEVSSHLN